MNRLSIAASCVVLSVATLPLAAQDAPRRGRPNADRPAQQRDAQPGERAGQPGERGGPRNLQLSPERAKAAWEVAATAVSKRLGLSEDQTKGVVKAYVAARESHNTASQKLRDQMRERMRDADEGDMRERAEETRKAMDDLNTAERTKLAAALKDVVGAELSEKAVASLGLFAPNWDRMVDVIAGFKLEAGKQQDALNAVETFIVSQAKIARDAERDERMEAMRSGREKLIGALKPILSEEQMAQFEQSMGGGRGRGGEGGRPGRGGT